MWRQISWRTCWKLIQIFPKMTSGVEMFVINDGKRLKQILITNMQVKQFISWVLWLVDFVQIFMNILLLVKMSKFKAQDIQEKWRSLVVEAVIEYYKGRTDSSMTKLLKMVKLKWIILQFLLYIIFKNLFWYCLYLFKSHSWMIHLINFKYTIVFPCFL